MKKAREEEEARKNWKSNSVPFEHLQFSVSRFVKCLSYFCPAFRDVRGPRALAFAPAGIRREIEEDSETFDAKKIVEDMKGRWVHVEFKKKEKAHWDVSKMREFVE